MSTSELEQVIQNYIIHQIHQSHIDPIMSAPSFSPSSSPPGTPKERNTLLAAHPADQRPGPPNIVGNYGTLDSDAVNNPKETDQESRGSQEEERRQRKDPAMTEELAMKEGRKNVMKTLPILAIGVRKSFLMLSPVQ